MKCVLALILCLCLAGPSWGAYSLISHITGVTTDGANGTTSAINTTGSNLIVVGISYSNSLGTPTLSDSKSNTWTPLTVHIESNVSGAAHIFYYCSNPSVGSGHTFSLSGATAYASICVAAFGNAKASSPFDVQNGGVQEGGTTVQVGNVTPSENGELLISGIILYDPGIPTIDSGFTIIDTQQHSGGVNFGSSIAYLIQTSAGSLNPTWTLPASDTSAGSIATFKSGAVSPRAFGIINNPVKM